MSGKHKRHLLITQQMQIKVKTGRDFFIYLIGKDENCYQYPC